MDVSTVSDKPMPELDEAEIETKEQDQDFNGGGASSTQDQTHNQTKNQNQTSKNLDKNKASGSTETKFMEHRTLTFESSPNVLQGKSTGLEEDQIRVVLKKNLGEEMVDMEIIYRHGIRDSRPRGVQQTFSNCQEARRFAEQFIKLMADDCYLKIKDVTEDYKLTFVNSVCRSAIESQPWSTQKLNINDIIFLAPFDQAWDSGKFIATPKNTIQQQMTDNINMVENEFF